MYRVLVPILAIALCASVGACASVEYRSAREVCYRDWLLRIPPSYRQILVSRERRTEVPDGTETCTTVGSTRRCEKGMRTEWVPYTAAETVDVNAPERERRVQACTRARCLQTYGNPDCRR